MAHRELVCTCDRIYRVTAKLSLDSLTLRTSMGLASVSGAAVGCRRLEENRRQRVSSYYMRLIPMGEQSRERRLHKIRMVARATEVESRCADLQADLDAVTAQAIQT